MKILSGICAVVLLICSLLWMSVKRKEKIPIRSFDRTYVDVPDPARIKLPDTEPPERIDVSEDQLLLSTRSDKKITLSRWDNGSFEELATVFRQEGRIVNWQLHNDVLFKADLKNRQIKLTDLRTNRTSAFAILPEFTRIIRINDSLCLLKSRDTARLNDNYIVYNYRKGGSKAFGNLLPDYNDGGFVNDGYFITDGKSRFYHICYYVSDIIAFDAAGHPIYKSTSVDKVGVLPKTVTARNGNRYISSETPVIHPAAAASLEFVFVASSIRSESEESQDVNDQVIDVYSTDKGEYKASLRINGVTSVRSLACAGETLYYLCDDHVGAVDISALRMSSKKPEMIRALSINR